VYLLARQLQFAGINDSALFVIESSKSHVAPFLEKGFSLVFTGHSLGAGTAALAAAHARTMGGNGYSGATAITFACPGIISAKNSDGSKSAACKALKAFVTTHILGYDIVPRASGVAVFTLLDNIFSNNWKEKTKKKMEEEAKKRLGAAAGALGGMMSMAAAAVPPPTAEELEAKAAEAKRIKEEIDEGIALLHSRVLLDIAITNSLRLMLQVARKFRRIRTFCPGASSNTLSTLPMLHRLSSARRGSFMK
jgi:hypothetical protein